MSALCRCGCRRPAERWYRGYTRSCYQRWLRLGRPDVLPPPRWTGGSSARAGRIEDYAELIALGESREAAARRIGVTARTRERYEAELRREPAA